MTTLILDRKVEARFWANVNKECYESQYNLTLCWEWTGTLDKDGYGMHSRGLAHRVAWMLLRGEIPEGLELDHLCRNRSCVNPDHLEPVTHQENLNRGLRGMRARSGRCRNGHEVTGDNARPSGRYVQCKMCQNLSVEITNARRGLSKAAGKRLDSAGIDWRSERKGSDLVREYFREHDTYSTSQHASPAVGNS